MVERYSYDVFGEPTIYDYAAHQEVEESSVGNPYMFTGRRYDSETGNYYYRARYYEPYIGRFMSSDPLGTTPDDKNIGFEPTMQYEDGMNLYAYVGNNPVNMKDPQGLALAWSPTPGGYGHISSGPLNKPGGRCCKKRKPIYKILGMSAWRCTSHTLDLAWNRWGGSATPVFVGTVGWAVGGPIGTGAAAGAGLQGAVSFGNCISRICVRYGRYDSCGRCR